MNICVSDRRLTPLTCIKLPWKIKLPGSWRNWTFWRASMMRYIETNVCQSFIWGSSIISFSRFRSCVNFRMRFRTRLSWCRWTTADSWTWRGSLLMWRASMKKYQHAAVKKLRTGTRARWRSLNTSSQQLLKFLLKQNGVFLTRIISMSICIDFTVWTHLLTSRPEQQWAEKQ